jgi:copper homeostasis protein
MMELISLCKNSQITLHRAFDMTENLLDTFGLAVQLKIDYILTSGGANTCGEGKDNILALLKKQLKTRVLIGGGLNADTIQEFLPFGARCYHMSGSEVVNSAMQFRKEGIFMGKERGEEYLKYRTSEDKIKQVHYFLNRENS